MTNKILGEPKFTPKSDITTKHRMFRTQIYASPENFTHPPDVMDVTFRRSGLCLASAKDVRWSFNLAPVGFTF